MALSLCGSLMLVTCLFLFWVFQTCVLLKSAFPPGTRYFSKHLPRGKGLSWYGPSAHPGKHFTARTLWTYFGAFLGRRGGTRVAPGTVPLRNPKGTSPIRCLESPFAVCNDLNRHRFALRSDLNLSNFKIGNSALVIGF